MLVHFPIALVSLGFLAELLFFYFKKELWLPKTGFYLLVFGTLTGLAAWLTGMFFTSEMSGAAGEVRETHETFALITIILLVITSLLRIYIEFKKPDDSKLKLIAFAIYALAAVSVSITGFFGGNLVYNYMMPL
jgi:uncharacterized membrane protein